MEIDKPNALEKPTMVMPLAASYNPRGVTGYTNTVTNALDQRKINSIYEPLKNATTDKATLYLTKRPGVVNSGSTFGTTGQVAYLASLGAGLFAKTAASVWVFNVASDVVRASNSAGTNTSIVTEAGLLPAYVSKTPVGGTDTIVLQCVSAATPDQRVFYSSAIGTWTEITDSDFPASTLAGKMEFGWGFALAMGQTGAGESAIFNSNINSLSAWSGSNYLTKQIQQDIPRGLAKLGDKVIAFGNETAEIFVNRGNEFGSPLGTIPELASNVGIIDQVVSGYTHYYATIGNTLYFVGRSGQSGAGLYMFDGQKFEKVSKGPIDKILAEAMESNLLFSVNAVIWGGKEAVAIQTTATSAATQRFLMFFPAWNDWFEWNSTIFTPVNSGRWHLGVGSNQHKLYNLPLATDNWQDDSTNYAWTHQFQMPKTGNNRNFMSMFQLIGDTSRSAQSIAVEFSDDDGQTWSTARNIDMTTLQKMITRCGSYYNRQVRLSYTGSLEVRLEAFGARLK